MKHEHRIESVRVIKRRKEDDLMYGEEAGMMYKYDLPVVNMPIKFRS